MKALVASTAIALLPLGAALAQEAGAGDPAAAFLGATEARGLAPDAMVGLPLFAPKDALSPGDLEEVGEITGIVAGEDGALDALLADVGGFLGLGERTIALPLADLSLIDGEGGGAAVVVAATEEQIEAAAPYEEGLVLPETLNIERIDYEGSGQNTMSPAAVVTNREGAPVTPLNDQVDPGTDTDAATLDDGTTVVTPQTPATVTIEDGQVVPVDGPEVEPQAQGADAQAGVVLDSGQPTERMEGEATLVANPDPQEGAAVEGAAQGGGAALRAPAVEREGYAPRLGDDVVLAELEGVRVYGLGDEEIGRIGYTVNAASSPDGQPLAVVDIGGFLGLGGREVALPVTAMTFLEGEGGLRAYIEATEDQLRALPEHEG